MTFAERQESMELDSIGCAMYDLIAQLYPICRSITGNGVRQSLRILQQHIPLQLHEIPTGTQVFDWIVPKEWNIREAYIRNDKGEKIVDFADSSLHVVNYSIPIQRTISLAELREHLHTLPEHPDWFPYRTAYYQETWGFCLSQRTLEQMAEGDYEVYIDSSLEQGHLTYGEYFLPGASKEEILISCHSCHPALCNDNLSGMALATYLANYITPLARRYSYRFLFLPGTIGAITWLNDHEEQAAQIRHGLVVACVGDSGNLTYKRSRRGDAEIDQAVLQVLKESGKAFAIQDFSPYGYDERQYCSPGFNLAVGSLTRTPHGRFAEYHTSADNLSFIQPWALADALVTYLKVCDVLEGNRYYRRTNPKCEPQLGRRGLYDLFGGRKDAKASELAMLWVLNYADGSHSLLDIAAKSGCKFTILREVAAVLVEHHLLEEIIP
ncbi:MAG: DUF4910 domain-containing protein [Caldilinea sp. CFX5]|nr:DUF4910 domain-containing protein [Caldilinea sp. CFX5]